MFGRLKIKRLASLTAPSTLSLDEAEEEQSKHAPTVALATTAVAEEVLSADEHEKEEFSVIKVEADAPQSNREILEFAATKIQSAFRGYLVSLNKPFPYLISLFLVFSLVPAN
jgi:hypothetical protein